jgi:hypothetical protein
MKRSFVVSMKLARPRGVKRARVRGVKTPAPLSIVLYRADGVGDGMRCGSDSIRALSTSAKRIGGCCDMDIDGGISGIYGGISGIYGGTSGIDGGISGIYGGNSGIYDIFLPL